MPLLGLNTHTKCVLLYWSHLWEMYTDLSLQKQVCAVIKALFLGWYSYLMNTNGIWITHQCLNYNVVAFNAVHIELFTCNFRCELHREKNVRWRSTFIEKFIYWGGYWWVKQTQDFHQCLCTMWKQFTIQRIFLMTSSTSVVIETQASPGKLDNTRL